MALFSVETGVAYGLSAALIWGSYLFVFKRYFSECPSAVAIVVTNAFAVGWLLLAFALGVPTIELVGSTPISAPKRC